MIQSDFLWVWLFLMIHYSIVVLPQSLFYFSKYFFHAIIDPKYILGGVVFGIFILFASIGK